MRVQQFFFFHHHPTILTLMFKPWASSSSQAHFPPSQRRRRWHPPTPRHSSTHPYFPSTRRLTLEFRHRVCRRQNVNKRTPSRGRESIPIYTPPLSALSTSLSLSYSLEDVLRAFGDYRGELL